jgi:MoxR-like ATPase
MTLSQKKGLDIIRNIINEISKTVVGKEDIKELLLVALLSQGHILIEGLPGTAKTTIARTFAHTIGGVFKRVQGTPDMLPADILGFYLYRPSGEATLMPGPIFANVLLADELNRTTPRTQAALLEAMQERQVTIERETHVLEQPFIVIGSQVPYGGPGTSPLSDVQADRFMLRVWSALPSLEEENRILRDIDAINEPNTAAVTRPDNIIQIQQEVKKIQVTDNIRCYILNVIDKLRHHPDLQVVPSARASVALLTAARALAFIQQRDFVIPDDVKRLLVPVLSHRVHINPEAEIENVSPESIINEIASEVSIPKDGVICAHNTPRNTSDDKSENRTDSECQSEEQSANNTLILTDIDDETASFVEKSRCASVDELINIELQKAGVDSGEIMIKTRWDFLKIVPEWEWLLIITTIALAVVMISIGIMSFR